MGFALQEHIPDRNYETVIVGLGETGLSVAAYLNSQGVPFVALDTRNDPPQLNTFKQRFPNAEVYLGELSTNSLQRAKQVIVSPGIDLNNKVIQFVVAQGAACFGDIELFVNSTQTPIVAITGSNGKSTVTSLITEMSKCAGKRAYSGGNLGPPALELLKYDDAELFVLELSSFQLESTHSLAPQVSAVLNISADHLDRHESIESYACVKAQIYDHADFCVVNRDDEFVSKMKTSGTVISFGLDHPADDEFGLVHDAKHSFLAKGDNLLLDTSEIPMQGESGILNSLAALAIGDALGLSLDKMLIALKKFKGLPHRFSLVGESQGVSWFNDSKGTNIGATISSLRGLKDNIILLAGGIFKGGDLNLLHKAVAKYTKHVILFGQDSSILEEALSGATSLHSANSMRDAVTIARDLSKSGDKVLLSPACASFDMYENYIARGEDFESCVQELAL